MRRGRWPRLLAGAAAILSSCATLMAPGPDLVPVSTTPLGATIELDDLVIGTTPMLVPVPRKSDGIFTLKLRGYKTVVVDRDKVLNGWFILSCLIWLPATPWPGVFIPVPAAIHDLLAHNQGRYSTEPLSVRMVPGSSEEIIRYPSREDDEAGNVPPPRSSDERRR